MDYRVIKEGDLFFLSDVNGDVSGNDDAGHGLYTKDTRFLSRMELYIDGEKPTLLASDADRSYFASMRLMKVSKDEGAIEMLRERFIYDGILYERVSLKNYFLYAIEFDFAAGFAADFQDMFIVRKYRTGDVGEMIGKELGPQGITIGYKGKDEIVRETRIAWSGAETNAATDEHAGVDAKVEANAAEEELVHFTLSLNPMETKRLCFTVTPILDGKGPAALPFEEGLRRLEASYDRWYESTTKVKSDVVQFDALYSRGTQDLRMLMTDVGYGDIPVAGLPWFAVPFGRDSLITSLFMLPLNPDKVKGTLRTLAAYQGQAEDAWRDEQPGKIMHEIRFGELVNTKQSPFSPYYGTVDSTPLFLVLIGEYVRWTGDLSLARELKPNIERALAWMDRNAGGTGEGFLTYRQEAEKGFPNQGWKDSSNSIVHETGEYAESPIALSEVQGYVYQGKKSLASVFAKLGDRELARRLEKEASALQARFEAAFWMEQEQFYAIALDKEGRQVRSVTSNPGHLLMTGLPEASRGGRVAQRLAAKDMFNGYGIRTMSTESTGYYPMSYHNGSVWPHDNAMIVLGLSRLGMKQEAGQVIAGMLDASKAFEYARLPELFCGHSSEVGGPVPYPTTCSPQAWSAGTSAAFLQAMLGLNPDVPERTIVMNPLLPEVFHELTAEGISIGQGHLSVKLTRSPEFGSRVKVEVIENTTGCELIIKE